MKRYIIKRILQVIPVIILASILSFAMIYMAPGDPAEFYRTPNMTDEDMEIVFPSIKDFIDYSGHSCKSGSLSKLTSKKWFRNRYILISRERVETIKRYNHLKKKYQKIISSI